MKSKLLYDENGLRTFAVVFDKDDDVRKLLLEFANANRFGDAHLMAIGAFSEVILGFFDRQRKDYKKIPSRNRSRCYRSPATSCSLRISRGSMPT
jgi:uncharacterized protein